MTICNVPSVKMSWADFQGIVKIASLPEGPLKHKNVLISEFQNTLSQAFLGIIRREPALRPHADQDVLALRPTSLLDEAIALLRAEVAPCNEKLSR